MKKSLLLSVITIGLLFTSCRKSSNSSYSGGQPQVNYQLVASNTNVPVMSNPAVLPAVTGNIVWTSGFANPDVVKFEATQNNIQVEFKSTNAAQIDLLSPVALTFGAFTLPPGIYNEIELKIDLDKMGTTPVLQLNGSITSGTVTLPIVVQVTQSVELQTEQHNVTITTDNSYLAVTTIDLSVITKGITADMLLNAQLTAGSIVISATSNHDLYEMILDNLGHEHHHCEFEGHHH